jgi:predicted permease
MMFSALKELAARLLASSRSRELDTDFAQELDSHLEMLVEDNLQRGMTPGQARRAALIRMGAPSSLIERHRDVRGMPAVGGLLQDTRFAVRLLVKDRWFAAAAIAALALGIGANAAGFTIVNAVFFRGLPVEDSGRLYILSWQNRSGRRANVSYAELENWRAATRSFAALAAYSDTSFNISDDRAVPEHVPGTRLTTNGFGTIRQPLLLGRDFRSDDGRPESDPVAIIGYGIWTRRYNADPTVLGKTLRVNGREATIIGVMPDAMEFPDRSQIWVPLIPIEDQQRNARSLRVFGRLSDDVDHRQARSELNGIGKQIIAAYPESTTDLVGVNVETFVGRFIGGAGRPMFITVMGAVTLVLLIACANVANLLLLRSVHRAREIAMRRALGATRWRVVRQLLVESVVLASIGGLGGVFLAFAGVNVFAAAMQSAGLPYWITFTIDAVVLKYVAAISVVTAIVFGLGPALHVSKAPGLVRVKESGRGSIGGRRERWFSTGLVVVELALTVVLLAGSGVMIRSFLSLYAVDIGVDVDRLKTMDLQLPASRYLTAESRRAFVEQLEPRLAAIPGVEAAAVTTGVPGRDGGERLLEIERAGGATGPPPVHVSTVTITPRFFETAAVPLVRGRNFTGLDGAPGAETVIVNERLAAQFFPGEDPIGRRLRFTEREPRGKPVDAWRTITAISGSILHGSSLDLYQNAVVYIPYRQEPASAASLLIRTTLPSASVMDSVRRQVQAMDGDQPVQAIHTLAQVLSNDRWWYRTWGGVFAAFAIIALVLSSVGLYAVMSYAVTQRTQEIGVRMAIGARPGQVAWLVLKRGLAELGVGLVIGLAAALALTSVLRLGLTDVGPHDPVTFTAIATLVTIVAVAACLVPARRATRVDPVVALRAE